MYQLRQPTPEAKMFDDEMIIPFDPKSEMDFRDQMHSVETCDHCGFECATSRIPVSEIHPMTMSMVVIREWANEYNTRFNDIIASGAEFVIECSNCGMIHG